MDYKAAGLKVGLEFHQRLDSHKLFCSCCTDQEEKVTSTIKRKQRPTIGELGEIDPTAALEAMRGKEFAYQAFDKSTCLVDADEEPPHAVNKDATQIALMISKLLNAEIPDEVHVMRKTVVDGSNTSGFQRTMMVGRNGSIETTHGKVGILGVYLEEEACGIVEEADGIKTYRMDRLGIPLVEIATDIMLMEPKQVQETALEIGKLLRVTGKVKRGLGTIRQDVNISIRDGARIEIKGVQDIKILDSFIEFEALRQTNLLELKEEMLKRGIKNQNYDIQSFTSLFEKTQCKLVKSGMDKGGKVFGIMLPHFKGLLGYELSPGKRFGSELAGIAKTFGIKGLIHTDEDLDKYNIRSDFDNLYKQHSLKEDDAVMIMVGDTLAMKNALSEIVKRINFALEGIPEETRKALDDGNTQFMRYLSGSHRMYPETDVPPVLITKELLEKVEKSLPEKPQEIYDKLVAMGLSEELADKMMTSRNISLFMKLLETKASPTLIASTLEETLVELRRQSVDITLITEKHFVELFSMVAANKIAKEAISKILTAVALSPKKTVEQLSVDFKTVSEDELKKALAEIIKEKPGLAFSVLMGEMMKKYRGKADGALIAKIVNEGVKNV